MSSSAAEARVVVAHRDPSVEERTRAVFRKKGMTVTRVKDRAELVERVQALLPSLVLLDLALPDMRGVEVVESLRMASPISPVLVVLDEDQLKDPFVDELAVADFLDRSFTERELDHRVERCLRAARVATAAALRGAMHRSEFTLSSASLPWTGAVTPPETTQLRDPESGRIDAKRIAEYLDVPLKKLAEPLRDNYKALHKSPAKSSVQEGLLPIERAIMLLEHQFRDRGKVRAWLNTPHPELGGRKALELVMKGHAATVADMLEAASAGIPT
jgi:CheY-like chemotaxis protein